MLITKRQSFKKANTEKNKLLRIWLQKTNFQNCELKKAKEKKTNLQRCYLQKANFQRIKLKKGKLCNLTIGWTEWLAVFPFTVDMVVQLTGYKKIVSSQFHGSTAVIKKTVASSLYLRVRNVLLTIFHGNIKNFQDINMFN